MTLNLKIHWAPTDGLKVAYDAEMREVIEQTHKEALEEFEIKYPLTHEQRIEVERYNLRVVLSLTLRSTAGYARRGQQIDIHYRLYAKGQHRPDLINTYVHELAHILATRIFGKNMHHSQEWRDIMSALGEPPSRCHKLDVSAFTAPKKPKRRVWTCKCVPQITWLFSDYQHTVATRKGGYSCRKCKTRLIFKETKK